MASERGCVLRLYCVLQPVATGLDVFEGRPKLAAWRDRVKKELSEELFNEAHELIMNMESRQNIQEVAKLEPFKKKFLKYFS